MRLRGTELSLWIGGMKDTQTAVFNGPIHKSTAPLSIAGQADPNAPGWFSGTIDEVRVSRFARGNFGNPTQRPGTRDRRRGTRDRRLETADRGPETRDQRPLTADPRPETTHHPNGASSPNSLYLR
jgi:hypothetical protein